MAAGEVVAKEPKRRLKMNEMVGKREVETDGVTVSFMCEIERGRRERNCCWSSIWSR